MKILRKIFFSEKPPLQKVSKPDRPEKDGLLSGFLLQDFKENDQSLFQVSSERSGKLCSDLQRIFPSLQRTTGTACVYQMGLFSSQLRDKQSRKTHGMYVLEKL